MRNATQEATADAEREAREAREEAGRRATQDADGPAPTAAEFRITDMQHWIDLCA